MGSWKWIDAGPDVGKPFLGCERLTDAAGALILCVDAHADDPDAVVYSQVSVRRDAAALIAAAPEMLEMLRRLHAVDMADRNGHPRFDPTLWQDLTALLKRIDERRGSGQ